MAAVDLPGGPAALLDRTRVHLATHLGGEQHLILGSGTALIARWEHRWTHDLDFFIEADPYARLQENGIAFERDLRTVGITISLHAGDDETRGTFMPIGAATRCWRSSRRSRTCRGQTGGSRSSKSSSVARTTARRTLGNSSANRVASPRRESARTST